MSCGEYTKEDVRLTFDAIRREQQSQRYSVSNLEKQMEAIRSIGEKREARSAEFSHLRKEIEDLKGGAFMKSLVLEDPKRHIFQLKEDFAALEAKVSAKPDLPNSIVQQLQAACPTWLEHEKLKAEVEVIKSAQQRVEDESHKAISLAQRVRSRIGFQEKQMSLLLDDVVSLRRDLRGETGSASQSTAMSHACSRSSSMCVGSTAPPSCKRSRSRRASSCPSDSDFSSDSNASCSSASQQAGRQADESQSLLQRVTGDLHTWIPSLDLTQLLLYGSPESSAAAEQPDDQRPCRGVIDTILSDLDAQRAAVQSLGLRVEELSESVSKRITAQERDQLSSTLKQVEVMDSMQQELKNQQSSLASHMSAYEVFTKTVKSLLCSYQDEVTAFRSSVLQGASPGTRRATSAQGRSQVWAWHRSSCEEPATTSSLLLSLQKQQTLPHVREVASHPSPKRRCSSRPSQAGHQCENTRKLVSRARCPSMEPYHRPEEADGLSRVARRLSGPPDTVCPDVEAGGQNCSAVKAEDRETPQFGNTMETKACSDEAPPYTVPDAWVDPTEVTRLGRRFRQAAAKACNEEGETPQFGNSWTERKACGEESRPFTCPDGLSETKPWRRFRPADSKGEAGRKPARAAPCNGSAEEGASGSSSAAGSESRVLSQVEEAKPDEPARAPELPAAVPTKAIGPAQQRLLHCFSEEAIEETCGNVNPRETRGAGHRREDFEDTLSFWLDKTKNIRRRAPVDMDTTTTSI